MTKADNKTDEGMVRKIVNKMLNEKKDKEEKVSELKEFNDKNPQDPTTGPYMVIYVKKCGAAFRIKLAGAMGQFKLLFIPDTIMTIENLEDNQKRIEADDRLTIIEAKLRKAPNMAAMKAYKEVISMPPEEKESILDKLTGKGKKKAPKKPKAKGKGKKK